MTLSPIRALFSLATSVIRHHVQRGARRGFAIPRMDQALCCHTSSMNHAISGADEKSQQEPKTSPQMQKHGAQGSNHHVLLSVAHFKLQARLYLW